MSSSSRERCVFGPRARFYATFLLLSALLAAEFARVDAGESDDGFVVSYATEVYRAGRVECEWRLFDPRDGSDTLYQNLGMFQEPLAIRWAPDWSSVRYLLPEGLMQADWSFGAAMWPVVGLPPDREVVDCWWEPASNQWRAVALVSLKRPQSDGQTWRDTCARHLWLRGGSDRTWRMAWAETVACREGNRSWLWRDFVPSGWTPGPGIRLADLQEDMSLEDWAGPGRDVPPPEGEPAESRGWRYLPSREVPGSALILRIRRTEGPLPVSLGPLYWTRGDSAAPERLEFAPFRRDERNWTTGMAEHDGFLLISGHSTCVLDMRTGRQVFFPRGYVRRTAVWVRRPGRPSPDLEGLRRLQRRFGH